MSKIVAALFAALFATQAFAAPSASASASAQASASDGNVTKQSPDASSKRAQKEKTVNSPASSSDGKSPAAPPVKK
ncbi:hypothetical protein GJA_3956 [Janthinobacterium agaricidamnosum NBRC 102515 = DSM 9628]|uniref:Uncharacterized protein n=1 Tax=Janthinobacterium agaricidamnosum NBRC 102515 = DSM 9628 TaxID=1349767 RepID=W0VBC9_9BURK|nr:hypothetical protein GJA_3956 [Janthinobacterium agaricidamnosum NBRC 102515 = DSM 9628]